MAKDTIHRLNQRILQCEKCPRLLAHCRETAAKKTKRYQDQVYHGKPVPNFGDAKAKLLIVGLAPGAHGANRTGRMFTGDRSGDFLYDVMHQVGLCNKPNATDADDGLTLRNVMITAACHCAPPGNKPTSGELANCSTHLEATFDLVKPRAVLCLGRIGFEAVLRLLQSRGIIDRLSAYRFSHGAEHAIAGGLTIFCSYHPSQQNTFTGRLTKAMMRDVFKRASACLR